MNRPQYLPKVMQHTARAFKKSFDDALHGKNCSDALCVLPQCVNFKLQTRHINTPQKDKQSDVDDMNRASSETAVNTQQNNNEGKLIPLNEAILDHDAEKQLLNDIEEFERILEGQKVDLGPQPDFRNRFEIDHQNSPPPYAAREYCQIPSQTNSLPSYISRDDIQFPRQISRAEKARKHDIFQRGGATFKEPSNPIMIHSTESDENPSFLSYYEQFMSTDEFAVPKETSQGGHAAKRTRTDFATTVLTTNVENTSRHIPGTTEQLPGTQRQPARKVFGVLSQILHMFEKPMSAEVEALFVHVLQKALRDIQKAITRDSINLKFAYFRPVTSL